MSEPYATRREVDLVRLEAERELAKVWARLELIDTNGTRGASALAVRIDNLIADVAELKAAQSSTAAGLDLRLQAHQLEHQNAAARRQDGGRWRITATIAAAGLAPTLIGLLVDLITRVH